MNILAGILGTDSLSSMMGLVALLLSPMIVIYSLEYISSNRIRYFLVLSVVLIATFFAVVSQDFLSFYVFVGIMTAGNYFLIVHNGREFAFRAGYKYILFALTGGVLMLLAILMMYNTSGSFAFEVVASRSIPQDIVLIIFALFLTGCFIETGAIPFHVWLPDAHPAAPTPISAFLSGISIKVGAYAAIRIILILFPSNPINAVLIAVGALSMLGGVALALLQTNVKRLLAYSSISQIGYIILGLGLGSSFALVGSMFHILNHALFKILLFLCMGSVIYATGERDISQLGGLAKKMPVTTWAFIIGSLAITGIPPFCGFASKALISEGSAHLVIKIILIITAGGTFATLYKLFRFTFMGKLPVKLRKTKEVPPLMLVPMLILAAACIAVGSFPNWVLDNIILSGISPIRYFDFFSAKTAIETAIIVAAGICIYTLGIRMNLFSLKIPAILDTAYLNIACSFEKACCRIKELHDRRINIHLLWVFLALLLLLLQALLSSSVS